MAGKRLITAQASVVFIRLMKMMKDDYSGQEYTCELSAFGPQSETFDDNDEVESIMR